jgi:SAM-dependent methyltransferase
MKEYAHIFGNDVSDTISVASSIPEITTDNDEQKRQRVKTEISELHQKYKTMRSDNLASHFAEHPEDWHHYHAISEKNEESFPEEEIPRNRIIRELTLVKTGRPKIVVDAGCGRAQIAQHFDGDKRFTFYNYDHVASHPSVISHDISRLPHEDMTADFVILSLAMWGSNCREYIAEARRVLDGGFLYIIEPTKRWTDDEPADRLRNLLKERFQIVEELGVINAQLVELKSRLSLT